MSNIWPLAIAAGVEKNLMGRVPIIVNYCLKCFVVEVKRSLWCDVDLFCDILSLKTFHPQQIIVIVYEGYDF